MKEVQYRGNCQCCGAQQAVVGGRMAKHGYTVKNGWFQGVCAGANYAPLQVERTVADGIIAEVRKEAAKLAARAKALAAGEIFPKTYIKQGNRIPGTFRREELVTPFAECPEYEKEGVIRMEIYRCENRARMGEAFARDLEAVANAVNGKPLVEVAKPAPAAPINRGDKKQGARGPLTVQRVEGARVYWIDDRGYKGWTGTQAFRKLPDVEK